MFALQDRDLLWHHLQGSQRGSPPGRVTMATLSELQARLLSVHAPELGMFGGIRLRSEHTRRAHVGGPAGRRRGRATRGTDPLGIPGGRTAQRRHAQPSATSPHPSYCSALQQRRRRVRRARPLTAPQRAPSGRAGRHGNAQHLDTRPGDAQATRVIRVISLYTNGSVSIVKS